MEKDLPVFPRRWVAKQIIFAAVIIAHTGRCMITIGTGAEVRYQAIDSITLLPAHSYAIIGTHMASIFVRDRLNTIADVVEDDRGRTLIALDPWQEQVQAAQAGLEVDFEQLSLDNGRAARSRTSVHKYSKFVVSFTPGSRYI